MFDESSVLHFADWKIFNTFVVANDAVMKHLDNYNTAVGLSGQKCKTITIQ